VVAGRQGLVFLFALGELATWRMLATEPAIPCDAPFGQPGPPVPRKRLQELLDGAGLPARITHLAWSARIRLQHRIASGCRQGRVFLAGDAAHSHSPAGAQGMNTGIHDATTWAGSWPSRPDAASTTTATAHCWTRTRGTTLGGSRAWSPRAYSAPDCAGNTGTARYRWRLRRSPSLMPAPATGCPIRTSPSTAAPAPA
jgi:FAD binding domain